MTRLPPEFEGWTKAARRRAAETRGGYRPVSNYGDGRLPAPYAEGDLVRLGPGDHGDRLRDMTTPGLFVVVYATSIGEGDEWYFRVWDGTVPHNSDRLHVYAAVNLMEPCELVDTLDPDGLALRAQMLADGWTYTPPPCCPACGHELLNRDCFYP